MKTPISVRRAGSPIAVILLNMKLLMKPVAPLLSLSLILTAPGLGCYEAAAAGFKAVRVAPLSSAMGLDAGALNRLPVSFQGAGLTAPGLLAPPALTSALTLPVGLPQASVTAPPALESAAAPMTVPATVESGASWRQRLSALGEEVKGIVSSRDVGDQAAGLGRIFEAGRRVSAAPAAPDAIEPAIEPAQVITDQILYSVRVGSSRGLGDHEIARLVEKLRKKGYYVARANLNTGEIVIEKGNPGSGFKTDVMPLRGMPEVLEISESRRRDTLRSLYASKASSLTAAPNPGSERGERPTVAPVKAVTAPPPSANAGSSGFTTKNVVLTLTGLLSVAGLLGVLGILTGFFASLLPQVPIGAADYIYAVSGKILVGVAAGIISLGIAGITAYILWRNGRLENTPPQAPPLKNRNSDFLDSNLAYALSVVGVVALAAGAMAAWVPASVLTLLAATFILSLIATVMVLAVTGLVTRARRR